MSDDTQSTIPAKRHRDEDSLTDRGHKHTDCCHTLFGTSTSDYFDRPFLIHKLGSIEWLSFVFRTCNRVDKKYEREEEWKSVFDRYETKFKELYERCLAEDKNFDVFRNMDIFSKVKRATMEAVSKAWTIEYIGDHDRRFIKAITTMNRTRRPSDRYANYASIIQSSGTGKSRLVDQTACTLFCLPFNLRASNPNHETAYTFPPPDDGIRDLLCGSRFSGDDETQINLTLETYDHFFAAVFTCVTQVLDEVLEQGKIFENSKALAKWWRDYLAQKEHRDLLYMRVLKRVAAAFNNETGKYVLDGLDLEEQESESPRSHISDPLDKLPPRRALTELLHKLKSHLPLGTFADVPVGRPYLQRDKPLNEDIRVMMYFDEADALAVAATFAKHSVSLLDLFQKALNKLSPFSIFTVFLSTSSNIGDFYFSEATSSSFLTNAETNNLQAPYTELPFDCSSQIVGMFKSDAHYIDEMNQVDWMCQFGRPLFWTVVTPTNNHSSALGLAYTKLSCGNPGSKSFHLAALTIRLSLQLDTSRREGREEAEYLVENHMRIAFFVPKHRQYLQSGTPSEPMLAEAAVRCMAGLRKPRSDSIAELLAEYLKNGIADKGERGEPVARLLVTEAFDAAARVEGVDHACRPNDKEGTGAVSVKQFLVSLVGEKHADKVMDMHPDNMGVRNGDTLREVFAKSVIRFTHFVRAGDDYANTSHAAFAALGRGFAVICRPGTADIDFYISVVLDKEKKLSEANTTAILIQVKDTQRAHSVNSVITTAEKLRFFPKESESRPYIFIVMELGVQPIVTKQHPYYFPVKRPKKDISPAAPSTPPSNNNTVAMLPTPSKVDTIKRGSKAKVEGKHPRFTIIITGCSPDSYGVVHDKDIYADLLASRSLFRESPRQEADCISAVKRLKPMWVRGSECWDWVQSDFLCPGQRGPQLNEDDGADQVKTLSI